MRPSQQEYLPAAGRDWALPLYDPLVRLMGVGPTRNALLEQAAIRPGQRVLEIGSGTGTLALLAKRLHPEAEVVGLDPDPKALARAKRKAAQAALPVHFDRGFSGQLPYPDASFDRVLSSFMFHHLEADERERMLREVRRVLRPAGSFHMVDFAKQEAHNHGSLVKMLHSNERLKDNSGQRIRELLSSAGLTLDKVRNERVLFGLMAIGYYRASSPAGQQHNGKRPEGEAALAAQTTKR